MSSGMVQEPNGQSNSRKKIEAIWPGLWKGFSGCIEEEEDGQGHLKSIFVLEIQVDLTGWKPGSSPWNNKQH